MKTATKITRGDWWTDNKVHLEEINFRGPFVEVYSRGTLFPNIPAITAGATPEEAKANAQLVVSAKRLYHALQQFTYAMFDRDDCSAPGCMLDSPCKLCAAYCDATNLFQKLNENV
jgi:hypothetical protein